MLDRLDHLVITVSDLQSAIEDYTKFFGFKPTWIGEHADLGTINALFPLENTYLELLAAKGNGIGAEMINKNLKDKSQNPNIYKQSRTYNFPGPQSHYESCATNRLATITVFRP